MNQEKSVISEVLPKTGYSADFKKIVTGGSLKELIEGSEHFIEPWDEKTAFQDWENERRFIAAAIDRDGTILDYGSANGFLLRCLQEWSEHKLDPYGLDINPLAIEKAKHLFSGREKHFAIPEEARGKKEFPKQFDIVYWAVGDNVKFEDLTGTAFFKEREAMVKKQGRLILGFYDKKEENTKKIEALKKLGIVLSGVMENQNGEQVLAWIDQNQ